MNETTETNWDEVEAEREAFILLVEGDEAVARLIGKPIQPPAPEPSVIIDDVLY